MDHMTETFKAEQREVLTVRRDAGVSAQQAARELEIACGKSNEELAIDGLALVEEFRAKGQSILGWAVALLALALLWGRV